MTARRSARSTSPTRPGGTTNPTFRSASSLPRSPCRHISRCSAREGDVAFLSSKVFTQRLRDMRAMMEANGLDALAFTSPDFFQYATNFHVDVQPWERPIVAVVPRDGTSFAIMNELSTHHIRFARERGTMWASD